MIARGSSKHPVIRPAPARRLPIILQVPAIAAIRSGGKGVKQHRSGARPDQAQYVDLHKKFVRPGVPIGAGRGLILKEILA